MLMFSLLLNIYAKWHPEMFNPYLHGSPEGCGVEGHGTEVGKCRRCSSTRSSAVVGCKTPALAFGFRPRERNMTLLLLEEVCTLASILYALSSPEGIRHTGWESREVLWGVGFS